MEENKTPEQPRSKKVLDFFIGLIIVGLCYILYVPIFFLISKFPSTSSLIFPLLLSPLIIMGICLGLIKRKYIRLALILGFALIFLLPLLLFGACVIAIMNYA